MISNPMIRGIVIVAGMSVGIGAAVAGPVSYTTVVLSGQPAPGLPDGVTFAYFSDPRLNEAGGVAFWADVAGPGITTANNGSIWSDRTGTIALVQREGDSAPFGIDIVWAALPRPTFDEDGNVGFAASLLQVSNPTLPTNLGVFFDDAGFVWVGAREGFEAPGGGGSKWTYLGLPVGDAHGGQAFNATCNSPANQGLWSSLHGATELEAIRHTAPPGGNGNLWGFLDSPAMNGDGDLVYRGSLITSPQSPEPVGYGVWRDTGAGPVALAVTGQAAPDTPQGTVFDDVAIAPVMNDSLRALWWASVTGGGSGPGDDTGYWSGAPGDTDLIAREGSPAAGLPGGVTYGELSRSPALNTLQQVAFTGELRGAGVDASNNSALWCLPVVGSPLLVVREGDQAPRLPEGVKFAVLGEPALGAGGQVAFIARVRGGGSTGLDNVVLYATDAGKSLVPLARTGDLFEVAPGDQRVIDEILFDSAPGFSQMRADGTVIFRLAFRDSSNPPVISYGLFEATLSCAADVDGSGELDIDDFIAFQIAFAIGDLKSADFTGDGVLDVDDFIAFQTAFGVGCP